MFCFIFLFAYNNNNKIVYNMAKEQTIYFTKQKGKQVPIRKEIELVKKKPKIAIESEKDLKRKLRGDKKPLVVEIPTKVSRKLAKELKDTAERQPKSLDYLNKKYASGTSIAKIKEYNQLLKKRGVDISNILEKKRKAVEERKGKEVQLPPEFYQLIKALKPEAFAREQLPSEKQEQERKELQIQADFINTLEDKIDNPDVQKQIASQFAILKTLKEKEKLLDILKKSDTSKLPPKIPKETKAEKVKQAEAEAEAEAEPEEAPPTFEDVMAELALQDPLSENERIAEKAKLSEEQLNYIITSNLDLLKKELKRLKVSQSADMITSFSNSSIRAQTEFLKALDNASTWQDAYKIFKKPIPSLTQKSTGTKSSSKKTTKKKSVASSAEGEGLELKKEKKVKGGALLQEVGKSRNDPRKSYQSFF